MPQAMERLFAIPVTSAFFPRRSMSGAEGADVACAAVIRGRSFALVCDAVTGRRAGRPVMKDVRALIERATEMDGTNAGFIV